MDEFRPGSALSARGFPRRNLKQIAAHLKPGTVRLDFNWQQEFSEIPTLNDLCQVVRLKDIFGPTFDHKRLRLGKDIEVTRINAR
jgi:hypothetical protein